MSGSEREGQEEAGRPASISAQPRMDARLSNPVVRHPASGLRALEY